MRIRLSSGGKIRFSTRRLTWSNRGGPRFRIGAGLSLAKSGFRWASPSLGGARFSFGRSGTWSSWTGGIRPFYFGFGTTQSGTTVPYAGVSFSTKVRRFLRNPW